MCILFNGQNQSEPWRAAPSALNHRPARAKQGGLQAPPGRPVRGKQALSGILDPAGVPQQAPEMLAIFLDNRLNLLTRINSEFCFSKRGKKAYIIIT